jgi:uncharacterized protein (TIGR03083 family)
VNPRPHPRPLDRAAVEDLLAPAALGACDDAECDALEAALAAHPDLAAEHARLREAAGLLAALEIREPAPALRDRVLRAAFARRAPAPAPPIPAPDGSSAAPGAVRGAARGSGLDTDPPPGTLAGLYAETTRHLTTLLTELSGAEWQAPTAAEGWDVLGVVGHLCGVEALLLERLDHEAAWTPAEFAAASDAGVVRAAAEGPEATVARWRSLATEVLAHPALALTRHARPGAHVLWDGPAAERNRSLVVRAFEIWNHGEDIRRALGRPLALPAPASYHLMADLGVRTLPAMLEARGRTHAGRSARVVLTGPGGGEWTIPLAPGEVPGEPAVTLSLDVVEFCFRVADRRQPADLRVTVSPSARPAPTHVDVDRLVQDILESAGALARP